MRHGRYRNSLKCLERTKMKTIRVKTFQKEKSVF
jgi:hypothetical protein